MWFEMMSLGQVQQEKRITVELHATPEATVEIGLCLAEWSTFTTKARGRLIPHHP